MSTHRMNKQNYWKRVNTHTKRGFRTSACLQHCAASFSLPLRVYALARFDHASQKFGRSYKRRKVGGQTISSLTILQLIIYVRNFHKLKRRTEREQNKGVTHALAT